MLALGRKIINNLDSILKSRDITLPTRVHLVKVMVFPVVMYGYESWTIKKAERWIIDAFEMWCWRRLLRVPWTARRSNQSILKEINPEYSLQGLMLKLKFQYFVHLMGRSNSLEKPDAGKDWRQEEKGTTEDEMAGWHQWLGHGFGWAPGVGDGWGGLACCDSWGCKQLDTTEWLNWTDWISLQRRGMNVIFFWLSFSRNYVLFNGLKHFILYSKKLESMSLIFKFRFSTIFSLSI